MNVLGLDMSSKKSGYSIFKDGKLWKYGVWELSHADEPDWRKRIAFMSEQVQECCKKYGIRKIYVEDVPPIIENTQTVKVLSALQGMLIATSVLYDIDVKVILIPLLDFVVGKVFLPRCDTFYGKRWEGVVTKPTVMNNLRYHGSIVRNGA